MASDSFRKENTGTSTRVRAGVRGNLFPGEFVMRELFPEGICSVRNKFVGHKKFFEPVNLFPTRGICSLFTCHTVPAVTLFFMRGTRC